MKLLRVFDIDDTLIVSDAKNKIYDQKNNLKCAITPGQFNKFKEFLNYLQKKNIARISYEEFGDNDEITIDIMENGDFIIKYICKLLSAYNKKSEEVAILTARGMNPMSIKKFLKNRLDVNIPVSNIRAIYWERNREKRKINDDFTDMIIKLKKKYNSKKEIIILEEDKSTVEFRKKIAMFSFIDMGYHNIIFYDDDKKNVAIMNKLEKELKLLDAKKYKNLKILSKLVPEKDRTKNYEIIEKRTRKKFLDYLYPNGNKCRDFFNSEYNKYIDI